MLELQIRLSQIISPKRVWNIPADKFSKKSLEYHSRHLGAKKLTFTNHFSQKGLTADKSSRISQQSSVWNIPADKFFKKVSGISRQTARWLEAGFQIQILNCSKKDKFSKKSVWSGMSRQTAWCLHSVSAMGGNKSNLSYTMSIFYLVSCIPDLL